VRSVAVALSVLAGALFKKFGLFLNTCVLLVTVCHITLQVTSYKTTTSVFKAKDEGMGVKKITWLQDYLMCDDGKETTLNQGRKKELNRQSG
jgi:hypothetical protein